MNRRADNNWQCIAVTLLQLEKKHLGKCHVSVYYCLLYALCIKLFWDSPLKKYTIIENIQHRIQRGSNICVNMQKYYRNVRILITLAACQHQQHLLYVGAGGAGWMHVILQECVWRVVCCVNLDDSWPAHGGYYDMTRPRDQVYWTNCQYMGFKLSKKLLWSMV